MENRTMGRITVIAKIENAGELYSAKKGFIPPEQVHRLEVTNALVDTGASYLSMPRSLIRQLGFDEPTGTHRARTPTGSATFTIYGPAKLTIQDRSCSVDIAEIAEESPVLIGQIPLEIMDFVADPKRQRLIGNPEHGGEWMFDMF